MTISERDQLFDRKKKKITKSTRSLWKGQRK